MEHCDIELLGEGARDWKRSLRAAADARGLATPLLVVEEAVWLLRNPGARGPEAELMQELMGSLEPMENEDDGADPGPDPSPGRPWQYYAHVLRGVEPHRARTIREWVERASKAAKASPAEAATSAKLQV